MANPIPRNAYDRVPEQIDFSESEDMAKQSFKDEVDINNIMEKYQRTGAITHFTTYQASYGDATSASFQEAMNTVTATQQMFDALPSDLRRKFGNSPGTFLDFVQDPANAAEMVELGLATQSPWPPADPNAPESGALEGAEAPKSEPEPAGDGS